VADDELLGSRYEVLRTVSEGRRASVLQALDQVHDRLVALKVYPVTDEDRDELLAEARLLMSIDPHPGLPQVRGDFFTDEGDRYVVVMNWVDGTDLQQVLEEQGDPGLPLEDVIDDLVQVAAALDHLHGHEPSIVHGDVKPANVVRAPNGRVVLVDFDIAGAHAGKGRLGTIGYVSPEVAAGEKPNPAADVFGLAATAVTLLNGEPPTDAAPTYPGVHPDQQGELARVLRAALSIDPARRPRSATRLVEKLRGSGRPDHPSGVVALLATEVADAARLWEDDPEEMRVAMRRLRDVRDAVIEQDGGRVVSAMNEGDHTIAVFREASAAAVAALNLHDRIDREPFPPGIEVHLRAAIAVGEAALVEGAYTGAVVDHVLRL
jgi:serine/threonine protein kinase